MTAKIVEISGFRFVYALVDPTEPRAVRYVGCTLQPARRLQYHLSEARIGDVLSNREKVEWLRGLLAEGLVPWLIVLEQVPPSVHWVSREAYWIKRFRTPLLTNFAWTPPEERPIPCQGECAGSPVFPVDGRCPVCGSFMETLEERNARINRPLRDWNGHRFW